MKSILLAAAAALTLTGCTTASTTPGSLSQTIAAAVAAPGRTAESRAMDEGRKPSETLAFLGLKPGMHAADLMTGSGYWAQIMAGVVGPKGSVTAWEPEQFYAAGDEKAKLDALVAATPGMTLGRYPFEAFAPLPRAYDFALINLSYHDLYWESERYKLPRTDPAAYVRALFAAMKPGAVVGVIDHAGPSGDTRAVVDKLHRIDPEIVRADFERAGFKLEAQGDFLRNSADDHTLNVFDKTIRGKTDRFVFRFRKPR